MENQNNNLQELEELRSQVAEFKNRMEQQEIVSRRLLKEAMKGSWRLLYNYHLLKDSHFRQMNKTRYYS